MSHQNQMLSRWSCGLSAACTAAVGLTPHAVPGQTAATAAPTIHRIEQETGLPANANIVEGAERLVVVDALLSDTASKQLRTEIDALGKPIQVELLTHPHPDRFAGLGNLTEGLDVPTTSVPGVNDVVRRDDPAKDALTSGFFETELPTNCVFPTEMVSEGDTLNFGHGLSLEAMDVGPAASLHDSVFLIGGESAVAFVGDLVLSRIHADKVNVQNPKWRAELDRVQAEIAEDPLPFASHGAPATPAFLDCQNTYLEVFDQTIAPASRANPEAATVSVIQAMGTDLPSHDLAFKLQRSIEPKAEAAGKL